MKKIFIVPVLTVVLLMIFFKSEFTQASSPADEPAFVKEFLGDIDEAESKLVQLAEAMPEGTYTWRPGEGVRSVSEVYLHIAWANYLWIKMSGGTVPEDAGFVSDFKKIGEWDTKTTNKTEIIAIIKKSFDALKNTVKTFSQGDLNKEMEFFGTKSSLRGVLISGLGHIHEHLGQSIAYARMNNVTPPWSKQ